MIKIQCSNCKRIHEVEFIASKKVPKCACGHIMRLPDSILPESSVKPITPTEVKQMTQPLKKKQPEPTLPLKPQTQQSHNRYIQSKRGTALLLAFFLGGGSAHINFT